MAEPLVSVLLPAYNAGSFLRPSVESILQQSYSNLEIILVDDGSTDGSIESLSDIRDDRISVIRQANQGKPVALNHALNSMQGEFYALQDADDLSHPHRLERQVRCLRQHSEVAGVFTGHEVILNGRRMAPRFAAKDVDRCRQDIDRLRMPALDPTVMYRVSSVREILFDPALPGCEGLDHLLRVGEKFPLMVVGECLYSYRINTNSTTRSKANRINEVLIKVRDRAAVRRGGHRAPAPAAIRSDRPHRLAEHGVISHFIESVLDHKHAGQIASAWKIAAQCAGLHPLDPVYYKPLMFALAPVTAVQQYRERRARSRQQTLEVSSIAPQR